MWQLEAVGYSERFAAACGRSRRASLATPNYSYEKRQRELAKKKQKEEKRQRKATKPDGSPDDSAPAEGADAGDAAATDNTPPATPA